MTSLSENTVVTTSGGLVELGYSQITSNFSVTATSATSPNTVLSTSIVSDGSPIIIDFYSSHVTPTAGSVDRTLTIGIWIDGVEFDRYFGYVESDTANDMWQTLTASRRATLSPGLHTITIVSWGNAGGTIAAGNGGNWISPAFLRVSKIIQASQFIVPLASAPLVTSLPSAPIDGQEIRYVADATNGVIWNLRYRAASSSPYKWEFIGGPPVTTVSPVYPASQSNSSYTNITSGPTFTVPLSGDYIVNHWGNVDIYSPVQERILLMCPATATFGASDVYAGKVGADFTTGGIQRTYWRAETTMTSLTANETITIQQKYAVGALTAVFFYCGLSIIPRRLG